MQSGRFPRKFLEGFFVSEALIMCSRRMLLWKAEKSFSACFSVAGGTFVYNRKGRYRIGITGW